MSTAPDQVLRVRGARTHNLKNLDLDIPKQRLVVITGPSGSGKSSLAFDTLYAEGQRRYVESLSVYARQFLQRVDPPEVDLLEGLSPAISIEQKTGNHNPRSTVGTVTEIHDHLRLLYARAGQVHCPTHQQPLRSHSVSQIVDRWLQAPADSKWAVLAPLRHSHPGPAHAVMATLQTQGYVRFAWRDHIGLATDLPVPAEADSSELAVVIDRLKVRPGMSSRLAESLETGFGLAAGRVVLQNLDTGQTERFSSRLLCPECEHSSGPLEPAMFSFNSPQGACPGCDGLGRLLGQAPEDGGGRCPVCDGSRLQAHAHHVRLGHGEQQRTLPALCQTPLGVLGRYFAELRLQGNAATVTQGLLEEIRQRIGFLNAVGLDYLDLHRSAQTLSGGEAQRIRLASQIGSGLSGVLYVLDEPSIGLHQRDNERLIGMLQRLRDLGNSVLVVEHDSDTMWAADHIIDLGPGAGVHGGEVVGQGHASELVQQRGSLTGQYLGGQRAIAVPRQRTPWRVDPAQAGLGQVLRLVGASGHNLQQVSADFPVGLLTCVTGVSGSGKSTLVNDTLWAAMAHKLHRHQTPPAAHAALEGWEHFDKVIHVDQAPIGRTPRSNPATYSGLLGPIRELLADMPLARERGYGPGRFSFNVAGGRCEACQGDGVMRIEMHFLPDVYVTCEVCHGQRYNRETLEVRFKGLHIAQILDLTVEQAQQVFAQVPALQRKLHTLQEVGLGYLRLGQNGHTLSGGEAQRLKLALELSRRDTGRTLYILDEPTTGLHFGDVALLLQVLQALRDAGNTLVVVEHHLDVIKSADWVIDLGPEGGTGGGRVVACGTPETIAAHPDSHTGRFLARVLSSSNMATTHEPAQRF